MPSTAASSRTSARMMRSMVPNFSMRARRLTLPTPGISVSTEVSERLLWMLRKKVMAKRCASSRTALQHVQAVVALVQKDALFGVQGEDLLLPLGEGDEVDAGDARPLEDLGDGGELPLAAVDDDEVGLCEALLLVRAKLGEAAGEHLLQACKVVCALDRLDLKAAVAAAVRLAVDKDDHRADLVDAADVGDVVALHAAGGSGRGRGSPAGGGRR